MLRGLGALQHAAVLQADALVAGWQLTGSCGGHNYHQEVTNADAD
jgi:hypothetical protein